MTDRPFSPRTLAERWDCSEDHIRNMTAAGRLRSFRIGRLIRIPADEVARVEGACAENEMTDDRDAIQPPAGPDRDETEPPPFVPNIPRRPVS